MSNRNDARDDDANRDPISGAPGAHSVGTWVGAALGGAAFSRYPGRTFDEIEPEMSRQWSTGSGASTLRWGRARHAARDAWNRVNGSA